MSQIAKRVLVENLDLLLLTIDEIVDDGLIVETDSGLITDRVSMRGKDAVLFCLQFHNSPCFLSWFSLHMFFVVVV